MSKKVKIGEEEQQQEAAGKAQPLDSESTESAESLQELSQQAEQLSRRVEELEEQRSEFRDLLQRKQAEFENYRKRTLRERDGIRTTARADVFNELLPVLDACEKGLDSLPDPNGDPLLEGFFEGYQLLVREIRAVFDRFDVETVPGPGQSFDPNFHEAVMREETEEHEDGTILEEFRRGYHYRNHLLRPSQVKVAVRTEPQAESAEAAQQEPEHPSGPVGGEAEPDGKIDIQA